MIPDFFTALHFSLALDFPMRQGTSALLEALDEITHRHGGRIYLAKDARCAPEWLARGCPRRLSGKLAEGDPQIF